MHRLQGSALPLPHAVGYTFTHQGKVVGAVEINGLRPVLWRPPAEQALHEAVTRAALALALLWDPAVVAR